MVYLKNTLSISVILLLILVASSSSVLAFSFDPPDELTGAPGEGNCTQCHAGNSLNDEDGSLMLTVPENYSPGEVYDIIVNLSRAGQSRWGFEMTALNSNGARAGTFATVDANTQLSVTKSKQYIQHTSVGTAQGKKDTNSWTFKWTAPNADVGPITFYAAGNAANGDFGTSRDYIYTEKATSDVPLIYGVTLTGVGALTKRTADASAGVRYTVRVTNTGNTNDVIRLSSSGSASATLSRTSVSLAAGASTNVTLTIPGNALTTAGDYAVKVMATSRGDTTKTAEITTTTTILPVYRVTLVGVGNLTKETTDASAGVSYTLRVTNSGNTNDTIRLTTSGDATATVSPTSISLNQGVSRIVTLRIFGTALAKAGDYEVKVKATSQRDRTKTAEITTTTTILPVYDVTLAGAGDLTTETADASAGVSYTLNVTNNGNTDDTINLATSGTAATLSQTSISLTSGASTEVTLTISADALANAGNYEVKVTATSQGNNSETAEVTTTTAILPVYGVTLMGDNLTKQTKIANVGVSYALQVTNTGNTEDTIVLGSSAEVGIGGIVLGSFRESDDQVPMGQLEIVLAAGASAEVIFTAMGDLLTRSGEYKIKVTATSQADSTKTAQITTTTTILPVYDVTLVGVDDLTTETADASEGVSYTFTVTNTGNTDDTINLVTSGDVTAILSNASVPLASGVSTNVTLTISGNALANAGDYAVKVKATSQGDSTKTAEITATTTILPVYDVTLAGVGNLTTETADASGGISYTLNVTNNGNTDDTINLATSGDTAATLSESSVPLASGVSTNITLTISDGALATAGNYEVKVTATSQGDNTKTAEVSTTTTILSVYSITLVGVRDAEEEGVSYTLTVTNTGNTDDVVDLATSDAAATLSQTSLSIVSGASAEATLTFSTDALETAGDYEVQVIATSQGDNTKTAEITLTTTTAPVYGVMLQGKGELEGATTDPLAGVSYTLTITNTGNTDDTIVLASSAEVGIEGSVLGSFRESDDQVPMAQLEIVLAAGASAEVIFTAAGDFFTKPGEYEIKVTVTSQGDSTKTAQITTKTTIEPVYGVMLKGKGELEGATIDILAGVSYTLTITNTGNTDDTIVLGSSAEVGIEGSVLGSFRESDDQVPMAQLEVVLAAGASTEVVFTAAGDFFTKPGEYEIKVTATSQGDSTKTAQITTKTTIKPIPGDINGDGTVNIQDLVLVANQIGKSGEGLSGDVNMDGEVNILDLVQVASYLGKTHAEIVQANQ